MKFYQGRKGKCKDNVNNMHAERPATEKRAASIYDGV